eukprot:953530-Prorocentrum_minimum.AAC.1
MKILFNKQAIGNRAVTHSPNRKPLEQAARVNISWSIARLHVLWLASKAAGPIRSLQDPIRSLQGPIRSLQGPIRSLQGPIRSLQGPIRSLQGPIRSFTGPIRSIMKRSYKIYYAHLPLVLPAQVPLARAARPVAELGPSAHLVELVTHPLRPVCLLPIRLAALLLRKPPFRRSLVALLALLAVATVAPAATPQASHKRHTSVTQASRPLSRPLSRRIATQRKDPCAPSRRSSLPIRFPFSRPTPDRAWPHLFRLSFPFSSSFPFSFRFSSFSFPLDCFPLGEASFATSASSSSLASLYSSSGDTREFLSTKHNQSVGAVWPGEDTRALKTKHNQSVGAVWPGKGLEMIANRHEFTCTGETSYLCMRIVAQVDSHAL